MPQISKVRIVNFYFNDGKRLIADEIFRFDKPDTGEALNTLLSLVNGGGKSVLVQLMLQPVVPRATVAGRKIESFFSKASDNCFILLEWKLDESNNKLITGIALAAVETAANKAEDSSEEENQRGYTAKYYTFIHQYKNFGDKNDIVNMELSHKKNNIFTAVSYETVRENLKSNKIECFGTDKQKIYKDRLDEFGISKTEWENVICEINKTEGGIDKFFSDYKSGDSLLDKLLIATLDRKMSITDNKNDDASLKTMLINYSKRYIGKAADVQLRDSIIKFNGILNDFKPDAEKLWKINDDQKMTISELHNFHYTLNNEKNRLDIETAELGNKIKELDGKINHIKNEEMSEKYYIQKAECDAVSSRLNECYTELEENKTEFKAVSHGAAVQKAAGLNNQLCDYKTNIRSLTEQITQKENDSDNRGHIISLKYSIWQKSITESERLTNQYKNTISEHTDTVNQLKTTQEQLSQYKAEIEKLNNKIQVNNGILSEKKDNLAKVLQGLSLDITPTLDDCYRDTDIIKTEKYLAQKINDAKETENSITAQIKEIKARILNLYNDKIALAEKLSKIKDESVQLQLKYDDYIIKENDIRPVLERYNIDFEKRFTFYPSEFIKDQINKFTAELNSDKRQSEVLAEQRSAAENGTMHLNKVVLSYINSLGIIYESGENYILEHPELLGKCPSIAYGIIIAGRDRELIFDTERAEWLPSVLPVYTYEDIDKILSDRFDSDSVFLSCYAKDYFADKNAYIKHINADINKLNDKAELKRANIEQLNHDMKITAAFNYTRDYLLNLTDDINKAGNETERITKNITSSDNDIIEAENTEKGARNKIKSVQTDIINAENAFSDFINWKLQLSEYYALSDGNNILSREYDDNVNNQKLLSKQLNKLTNTEAELKSETDNIKSELNTAANNIEEFKDTPTTLITDGKLSDLLGEYRMYQDTISEGINSLKHQLGDYMKLSDKYVADIDECGVSEDEYTSAVYSKTKENQLQKRRAELDDIISNLSEDIKKAERKFDYSEIMSKKCLEDITLLGGELLSKSEIGKDFEKRINITSAILSQTKSKQASADKRINEFSAQITMISRDIKKYVNSKPLNTICLESDISAQYSDIFERLDKLILKSKTDEDLFLNKLKQAKTDYSNKYYGFTGTLEGLISLINNTDTDNDRYFTVICRIDADCETYSKLISQINTDLLDIDNSRKDIIIQCLNHGRRVYDELKKLSDSSRIKLPGQKTYRAMLRFNLSDNIDDTVAMERIGNEIDASVTQICSIYAEQKNDTDIEKFAEKAIRSRNLLNSYIGTDNILIDVYKIDVNNQNCSYRRWETAITNNSGGEKFVIFFSVMLAIMSYSRSAGISDNRSLSSVLIMDNPFGPISSEHLLIPMFTIAKHFKVQLICLSDISKTDITKCFDVVCKLKIRKLQLGNTEMLQCEGNERIEHAFYRTEQLSFWE